MPMPAPKDHYTFADCLIWDENDRAELIDSIVAYWDEQQ